MHEVNMHGWLDGEALAEVTGVVVPAYFSARTDDETVTQLLHMTLADLPRVVTPSAVVLVTDGDDRTARLAEALLPRLAQGMRLLRLPENQGKLGAMRAGTRALLDAHSQVRYLAYLDGDGDHMAAVVPRLVRTAAHVAQARGVADVLVIGSRASRTRPMGWLRGELEELLDQVTVDALTYTLARQERVLDVSCLLPGRVCDISSGFKVYSRSLATSVVAAEPQFTGTLSRSDYDHYGPETMCVVEAALMGATLIEAQRPTWDGQPTTAFGEFRVVALYGELLAWVWQRLDISVENAAAMFDNRAPARELRTTGDGTQALGQVRQYALERLQAWRKDAADAPKSLSLPPFF